jgi:protein-disulfide isomerase
MTGITIRREFFPTARKPAQVGTAVELSLPDWRDAVQGRNRFGPVNAPVTLVEFADFECPACRHFAQSVLPRIREKYPEEVAMVFRHWPLPYHRFAIPAARALECASDQGRFHQMHDALYADQDSLGLKSLEEIGAASGVTDRAAYGTCLRGELHAQQIGLDAALAQRLGAIGTPTILINGKRLNYVPTFAQLDELVSALLRGE